MAVLMLSHQVFSSRSKLENVAMYHVSLPHSLDAASGGTLYNAPHFCGDHHFWHCFIDRIYGSRKSVSLSIDVKEIEWRASETDERFVCNCID